MTISSLIGTISNRTRVLLLTLICIFVFESSQAIDYNKLSTLALQRYGENTRNSIIELQSLMESLKNASDNEKIMRINEFFNNKIKFDDDINIWGETDYWATPLESLGKGRGDCEDYSIAKYVFLKALNIPEERLKLTYVKARIGGPYSNIYVAHMILSYYATPTAEPLILDSLISEIKPASRRNDLSPIFSFNSQGLWTGANNTPRGDSLSNLSRWRGVLVRIQADGIE